MDAPIFVYDTKLSGWVPGRYGKIAGKSFAWPANCDQAWEELLKQEDELSIVERILGRLPKKEADILKRRLLGAT